MTTPTQTELTIRKRLSWAVICIMVVAGGWQYNTLRLTRAKAAEAEHHEQLLGVLVNVVPNAIVACDENKQVIYFNPAAEELFGYTAEEMIGTDFEHLVSPSQRGAHCRGYDLAVSKCMTMPDGWELHREALSGYGLTKDGEDIPILVALRGVKFQDKIQFVASITSRETGELQIRESPLKDILQQEQKAIPRF